MRVNNDMLCDLAALVEFDDASLLAAAAANASEAGNGRLAVRFLRYAFIPGLGVGHPAILYDEARRGGGQKGAVIVAGMAFWKREGRVSSSGPPHLFTNARACRPPAAPFPFTHMRAPLFPATHPRIPPACRVPQESDLYWMVTNINRDSTRNWKQPDRTSGTTPNLHITAFSKCEVDRSTLALYYSSNLVSWVMAGMVDYHISLGRHFAYPHMIIDGRDLLVVSRAAFAPWARDADAPLNDYYNNHNSNTIAFHRVKNFRHFANIEWVRYQGPYSRFPRRTAMKDEVESAEGKAFVAGVAEAQKAADEAAAKDAAASQAGKGGEQQQQGADGGQREQQQQAPKQEQAQQQAPKHEQQQPKGEGKQQGGRRRALAEAQ
jgi:hypothetical protein